MIDRDKIPEPTYIELVDMFGKEKAEELIIKYNYNHHGLTALIFTESIVRKYKLQKFRAWVIKKTGLKPIVILFGLFFIVWIAIIFLRF